MKTVIARDGTKLACWRGGQDPPLLLVHGSVSDTTIWSLVQPALEKRFTVHAMNRRGREGSGALVECSLEREFEDVAAVVDSIGEPVHVLGHSFGALCALGAALKTNFVRSLMLYEPPPPDPQLLAALGVLPAWGVVALRVRTRWSLAWRPPRQLPGPLAIWAAGPPRRSGLRSRSGGALRRGSRPVRGGCWCSRH